jgi:16S rRNA (cytosine967-C5)-methyltransferase
VSRSGPNVRVLAWRILRERHATPMRLARAVAERARLAPRERKLLFALVDTELRRRGTLNALARHFSEGKADGDATAHLALGLAQAFLLEGFPEHAVLAETLRAARLTLGDRPGRSIERALRAALAARTRGHSGDPRRDLVLRDASFAAPVFRDPAEHPLLWAEDALSMPIPLVKRWTKRHGEAFALELARGFLEAPDASVRVPQDERESVRAELERAGVAARSGGHPALLLVPRDASKRLRGTAAHREGRLLPIAEPALRAADLAAAQPGESVLDLRATRPDRALVCALAGAHVVALLPHERRRAHWQALLARHGLADRVELRGAEATESALHDVVLVDAPSSDTGRLGARPAARWSFSPARQAALADRQLGLLAAGARRVRPGGRLVYSTASIEPEENERRVRAFLGEHPELELADGATTLPRPREAGGPLEGGYAARLRRRTQP